jgi:hypothetical protein
MKLTFKKYLSVLGIILILVPNITNTISETIDNSDSSNTNTIYTPQSDNELWYIEEK